MTDWRLTRVDSYGRGAGARFKASRKGERYAWGDMTFIEVEPPYRIVAAGRGGKFNRNKTWTTWTLEPPGHRHARRGDDGDRAGAAHGPARWRACMLKRGWTKRRLRKALSRLQSILEENLDRGARVTVGGL